MADRMRSVLSRCGSAAWADEVKRSEDDVVAAIVVMNRTLHTTRTAAYESVALKPDTPAFRATSWTKNRRMILALVWTDPGVGATSHWKLLPELEQP